MRTEAGIRNQRNSQMRYDKENTKRFALKVNKKTDADILEKLNSVPNRQGYIKRLIREDIARNSKD